MTDGARHVGRKTSRLRGCHTSASYVHVAESHGGGDDK